MRNCGVCDGERELVWWMMGTTVETWAELTQVSSGTVKDRPAAGRTSVTGSSCCRKGARHWLLNHHLLHLGTVGWVCSWWQKNPKTTKELRNKHGKWRNWKWHRDLNLGVANKTNDTREERNSWALEEEMLEQWFQKKIMVAAGKEGKVTKYRTQFCRGVGNGQ